ncbi:hypothetical protein E4U52_000513, partial [Claviceps spartinae]
QGPGPGAQRRAAGKDLVRSGERAALQRYADRLEDLRNAAASEFKLRGPFPFESSGRIMQSANKILDGFFAMSLVTQPRERLTSGEKALLEYTATERAELCDRICHIFQLLASSIMLEYSLTDAIPSMLSLRDRLLSKFFHFRAERVKASCPDGHVAESALAVARNERDDYGSVKCMQVIEEDYALLYAYVLVTGQVVDELGIAAAEIEGLLGAWMENRRSWSNRRSRAPSAFGNGHASARESRLHTPYSPIQLRGRGMPISSDHEDQRRSELCMARYIWRFWTVSSPLLGATVDSCSLW